MSSHSTQRIINDPNRVVEDMLQGFFKAHRGLVAPIPDNPRVVKYARAPIQGKVGVVTGGGSGHKRRGVAGEVLMWKVGGAKAALGGSLDEVVVLVSGLGATPVMELYIAYSRAHDLLEQAGIQVHRAYVGNYFTSLEMMGITFTVLKLDDELKGLIDLEAESAGLTQLAR
jgi:dihydroxyacetone kinase